MLINRDTNYCLFFPILFLTPTSPFPSFSCQGDRRMKPEKNVSFQDTSLSLASDQLIYKDEVKQNLQKGSVITTYHQNKIKEYKLSWTQFEYILSLDKETNFLQQC